MMNRSYIKYAGCTSLRSFTIAYRRSSLASLVQLKIDILYLNKQ